jgi:nitrogen PTS system EIIA component
MSYLSGLLRPEQISLALRATDSLGVLRELTALVPEIRNDPASQEKFLNALVERERMHSTALGDGIALPHARNPLGVVLPRSLVAFGRHAAGIPFGAADNKPVRLFFLLVSANQTEHLAILARLSRVLRDVQCAPALLAAKAVADISRVVAEIEQRVVK